MEAFSSNVQSRTKSNLIIILQSFLNDKATILFSNSKSFKYEIPPLKRNDFNRISNLINMDISIANALNEISTKFSFNQTFLIESKEIHFEKEDLKIGLMANSLAWNPKTPDPILCSQYLSFLEAFLIYLKNDFDVSVLYCLLFVTQRYVSLELNIPEQISAMLQLFIEKKDQNPIEIAYILESLLHSKACQTIFSIIQDTLINVISTNSNQFQSFDFSEIISFISQHLVELDPQILSLTGVIADVQNNMDICPLFHSISAIVETFFSDQIYSFPKIDTDLIYFTHLLRYKLHSFIQMDSYDTSSTQHLSENSETSNQNFINPESYDDPEMIDFSPHLNKISQVLQPFEISESKLSLNDFLTSEQIELANKLSSLFSRKYSCYLESFFEGFNLFRSNPSHYAFLIVLLRMLHAETITNSILDVFFKSPIFNEDYISFNPQHESNLNFDVPNTLKAAFLDLILTKTPTTIQIILKNAETKPLLFIEYIARIHLNLSFINLEELLGYDIISLLGKMLSHFGSLETHINTVIETHDNFFKSPNEIKLLGIPETFSFPYSQYEKFRDFVHKGWSTLFTFISTILETSVGIDKCFNVISFVSSYLVYFIHQSFQASIFTVLQHVLEHHKPNSESVFLILRYFSRMIALTIGIPETDSSNLYIKQNTVKVISQLYNAARINPPLIPLTAQIAYRSLSFFIVYPTSDLLSSILGLFSLLFLNVGDFTLTNEQILKFGQAILVAEPDYPSDATISLLFSMMARKKNVSQNTIFLIENPSLITLIFAISRSKFKYILDKFNNLCKFSIYNISQCCKGQLDQLLISIVYNDQNPFFFSGFLFNPIEMKIDDQIIRNSILPSIDLMFSCHCTQIGLYQFLKCAVPHNKKGEFPKYSETIISHFSSQIDHIRRTPQILFDFHYNEKRKTIIYTSTVIEGSKLEDGFSLQMWINVDIAASQNSGSGKLVFFSIIDVENYDKAALSFFLNGLTLYLQVTIQTGSQTIQLGQIESCHWVLCSLIFRPIKNQVSSGQIAFITNDSVPNVFLSKIPEFNRAEIRIGNIGKEEEVLQHIKPFCYLGPYRLTSKILQPSDVSQSISHFEIWKNEESDLLQTSANKSCINIQNPIEVINHSSPSFFDNFIPFFYFVKQAPPHFIERILDFMLTVEHQNFKKWQAISDLLLNWPSELLTYSLYSRFLSILHLTNSHSLIKYIIFNPQIWISAKANVHQRIINNWVQIVYPEYSHTLLDIISFSDILVLMRAYYYFEPIETDIISKRERDPNLDIAFCRNSLYKIICSIESLKVIDYESIFAHISTCSDEKQIESLLQLLIMIKDKIPKPKDGFLDSLLYLISHVSDSLFIATISTLAELSGHMLSKYVELILPILLKQHYTPILCQSLIDLLPKWPELLPLVCSISINTSMQVNAVEAFVSLSSDAYPRIMENSVWFIWPIILILNLHEITKTSSNLSTNDSSSSKNDLKESILELQNKGILVLRDMIKSFSNPEKLLDIILSFLDILEYNRIYKTRIIILGLIREFLILSTKEMKFMLSSMIGRSIRFIFYQLSQTGISDSLRKLFKHSPFADSIQNDNSNNKKIFNDADLNCILMNSTKERYILTFSGDMNQASTEIFKMLIPIVAPIELKSDTEIDIAHLMAYFASRNSLNEFQRCMQLDELTIHIHNYSHSLIVSYIVNLRNTIQTIKSHLDQIRKRSFIILSSTQKRMQGLFNHSMETFSRSQISYENETKTQINSINLSKTSIWEKSLYQQIDPHISSRFSMCYTQPFISFPTPFNPLLSQEKSHYISKSNDKSKSKEYLFASRGILVKGNTIQNIYVKLEKECITIVKPYKRIERSVSDLIYVLQKGPLIEIHFSDGKNYAFDFYPKNLSRILNQFSSVSSSMLLCQKIDTSHFMQTFDFTNSWVSGKLSNFSYLARINFFAKSRNIYPSFPNTRHSPIYPLILDWDGKLRNITIPLLSKNPNIWRNFFNQKLLMHSSYICEMTEKSLYDFEIDCESKSDTDKSSSRSEIQEGSSSFFEEEDTSEIVAQEISFENALKNLISEVPQEFYTCPEVFSGQTLPPWASNEYEFVYFMRTALERPEVTKSLPKWLMNTFPHIFRNHPERSLQSDPDFQSNPEGFTVFLGSLVDSVSYLIGNFLTLISQSHTLSTFDFRNLHSLQRKNPNHKFSKNNNIKIFLKVEKIDPELSISTVTCFSDGCILFDTKNERAVVYTNANPPISLSNQNSALASILHHDSVVSSENLLLITQEEEGKIFVVQPHPLQILTVCNTLPDSPMCVAASLNYRAVVMGSKNGRICIFSLTDGKLIHVIHVDANVQKILVTKGFGYILAYVNPHSNDGEMKIKHEIRAYTINGFEIKRKEIDWEIEEWVSWKNSRGFDFVVLKNENNKIFELEVGLLKLSDCLFEHTQEISGISYISDLESIIVLLGNHIRVIPFEGKETNHTD